tara:strand:+ start:5719 stop:6489 length:771 start_codon:yes stop_codon:yes gene_type:complete
MKRILAVLVNYGDEQLSYLQEVINGLRSFKNYDVSIIVHSNIELPTIQGTDAVYVIELDDYQLLPLTCKTSIWNHKDDFDIFIFGENDHLFHEHHVDKYLEYVNILPKDRIAGLIQYEENETGRYYPAYHGPYVWDYNSVEVHGDKKFAHFTNLHQATFILTKEQLSDIGEQYDFTQFFGQSHYSVKCKVNTDVYQFCGMKKMICISDFEDNLIHHLPNVYIDGAEGYVKDDGTIGNRAKQRSGEVRMINALTKLW